MHFHYVQSIMAVMQTMDEIVYLISTTYSKDGIGNTVPVSEVETKVFAERFSASQNEFFKAAQEGFRPELGLRVWKHEYSGERYVKIGEVRYEIYRTYVIHDKVELYLRKSLHRRAVVSNG